MSEIGIPRKGRNAAIALEHELDVGAGFIVDLLNGYGKTAAKTGENLAQVEELVDGIDFVEMEDTGRLYQRPVFTEFDSCEKKIVGGVNDLGDCNVIYRGLDTAAEQYLEENNISKDQSLEDYVSVVANKFGYSLEELYGDEDDRWVKWGLMNSSLDNSVSKVLCSKEFENLGRETADRYGLEDYEIDSFSKYGSEQGIEYSDEEELIYEAPSDVAGVYMWVSGNTAEDMGLEVDPVEGFRSKLGRFEVNNQ